MNKKNFRVIFNKNRGMLMAVAENVSSQGKGAGAGSESGATHSPLMRLAHLGSSLDSSVGPLSIDTSAQVLSLLANIADGQVAADSCDRTFSAR